MKEKFLKTFANLPIPERSMPIYVDQKHGALSWYVVKLEVDQNTDIGNAALEFLSATQII